MTAQPSVAYSSGWAALLQTGLLQTGHLPTGGIMRAARGEGEKVEKQITLLLIRDRFDGAILQDNGDVNGVYGLGGLNDNPLEVSKAIEPCLEVRTDESDVVDPDSQNDVKVAPEIEEGFAKGGEKLFVLVVDKVQGSLSDRF